MSTTDSSYLFHYRGTTGIKGTFAVQYQEQNKEIYGTAAAGGLPRNKRKGTASKHRIKRTALVESSEFERFWKRLALKTDYTVAFDGARVIARGIEALNGLAIADYEAEAVQTRIRSIGENDIRRDAVSRVFQSLRARVATPFQERQPSQPVKASPPLPRRSALW